ncbi:MAG: CoA transferase [Pseudomonadales bacterium]
MSSTDKPLSGFRILDLTHVWAGPLATRILGDMGAEVLKLETAYQRGTKSAVSAIGLYAEGLSGEQHWNRQAVTNKLNRNKKGICIDLKAEEGKALFLSLVSVCDVVIENFSAFAMKKLNLGFDVMQKHNANIIYIGMPGYGGTGPNSDYLAFGPSVEPMTGLSALMGYSANEPRNTAMAWPDAVAGVTAAAAVVTALAKQKETGKGCHIDLALHESAINMLGEKFVEAQLTGKAPEVRGNRHAEFAPQGIYPCAGEDEWICISCQSENAWLAISKLCEADWQTNPDYLSVELRQKNHDQLDQEISTFTRKFNKQVLMKLLQENGIAAGAVMKMPDIMNDEQVKSRDYFVELGDEEVGVLPFPGSPVLFDNERAIDWRRAPKLGEHNQEVLSELLGLDESDIRRLSDAGIITDSPPD